MSLQPLQILSTFGRFKRLQLFILFFISLGNHSATITAW